MVQCDCWEQWYTILKGKCSILQILLLWLDLSHKILYLLLNIGFPCLNIFTAQKIRKNTAETPFGIHGASTERQNNLRFKTIVDGKISFILEFDRYSSD